MPVTLPAHAAAILPFCGERFRWLPPVALVIGSAAPDFAYLTGIYGTASHSVPGLFTHCLPKGIAAFLWTELLLLPMLQARLPRIRRFELARFTVTRGVPRTAKGWLAVMVAILLGASTHQLWDGFTHVGWFPERHLFRGARIDFGLFSLPIARVLWAVSSVVGSVLVVWFMARRYPTLPLPAAGEPKGKPLLIALAAGVTFGLIWRALFPSGYYSAWQILWSFFWAAARYGAVAITVLGAYDFVQRFRAASRAT